MITLDTNVIVRVLVGDDPEQTPLAERTFVEACRGDGVFLTLVVVAELGWILSAGYGWDRATIQDRLARLIRTQGVFVEEPDVVAAAIDRLGTGRPELGDLLIAGAAREVEALPVWTFDQRFAREPDVELLTDAAWRRNAAKA